MLGQGRFQRGGVVTRCHQLANHCRRINYIARRVIVSHERIDCAGGPVRDKFDFFFFRSARRGSAVIASRNVTMGFDPDSRAGIMKLEVAAGVILPTRHTRMASHESCLYRTDGTAREYQGW
jgi:hypothetical protein